jgi:hypothetical protein
LIVHQTACQPEKCDISSLIKRIQLIIHRTFAEPSGRGRSRLRGHILTLLEQSIGSGLKILPCERVNLDHLHTIDYKDDDEHPVETPFEDPPLVARKKRVEETEQSIPTILKFFLDGSRRTYKVADIIFKGKYLPLVAGQIGVGVIERKDDYSTLAPLRKYCTFKNVLAFPDVISTDDLKELEKRINEKSRVKLELIKYTLKEGKEPVDLGVAKINIRMQDEEIKTVLRMSNDHLLSSERLLIIDGPLRFKKDFDIVQFRNVVGLSKSFRPTFKVGKGSKCQDVGSITFGLECGERTSVFKISDDTKVIGTWYLRIRKKERMSNPLQGILKMERYATDPLEIENGLDSIIIDNISSFILRERNVTPYGKDMRWATHIYPIFIAETYIKSSFMSDIRFKASF